MTLQAADKFFDRLETLGFSVDLEKDFLALDKDEFIDMTLTVERKGKLKVYKGCFSWYEVVQKVAKDFGLVSKKKK